MRRPMHQFTPAQFYRMRDAGVLNQAERVELLRGYLVLGFPRDDRHKVTTQAIQSALTSRVPAGWVVRSDCHITLTDSVTEPDLVIVPSSDGAVQRLQAATVALVVEIANQGLQSDRTDKIPLYARHGIPIYWIVNLADREVEVYEQPTGASPSPTYGTQRIYGPGDAVPFVLGGANVGTIPVADLLP